MRDFDMSEAWRHMVAMFQANRDVLITLSGLFFFVPSLLMSLMAGEPAITNPDMSFQETMAVLRDYFTGALPWIIAIFIATGIGALAIWRQLLAPGGTSLGSALGVAMKLLVPYILTSIAILFGVWVGLLFLIVPGLYLHARLSLFGPSMAAKEDMSPINAVKSSWAATRNNGWVVLLFILIVTIVGVIAVIIGDAIFGTLFALILPENIANIGSMVVEAITGAAMSLASVLVLAAVYRQLGPRDEGEAFR